MGTSCGRDGSGKVGGILLAWRVVVSTCGAPQLPLFDECIQSGDDPQRQHGGDDRGVHRSAPVIPALVALTLGTLRQEGIGRAVVVTG